MWTPPVVIIDSAGGGRRCCWPTKRKRSFKDYLLSMPNVGEDKDFERGRRIARPVG